MKSMTVDEMEQLPDEYVKKYTTFIIKNEEMQLESTFNENINNKERYSQIKNLSKLQTNEQKSEVQDTLSKARADIKGDRMFKYTKENYMQRQPRFDITQHSYNLEQFKEYTQLYEKSWK